MRTLLSILLLASVSVSVSAFADSSSGTLVLEKDSFVCSNESTAILLKQSRELCSLLVFSAIVNSNECEETTKERTVIIRNDGTKFSASEYGRTFTIVLIEVPFKGTAGYTLLSNIKRKSR